MPPTSPVSLRRAACRRDAGRPFLRWRGGGAYRYRLVWISSARRRGVRRQDRLDRRRDRQGAGHGATPGPAFATRAEATDRYLKISGLIGLVDPSSPEASVGVLGSEGEFRVAMDPRAYGAVGPSIETLLRLSAAPLRLAAGSKDAMVTLDQMRRIDPAAQVFEGAGHNAHVEAPEQVWKFVEGSR